MIASAGPITVATPGTPVPAITNLPVTPRPYSCHGVLFQALPTNTGKVYIGTAEMDPTAFTGLFAMLAIPTDNQIPSFSAALTITPNGMVLDQFYVDADNADDGVLLTYLVT